MRLDARNVAVATLERHLRIFFTISLGAVKESPVEYSDSEWYRGVTKNTVVKSRVALA